MNMNGRGGEQLPLDLGHRSALGMADFMIADSNAEAVAWLDRWPDWPHYALALYGPAGSGKTHLTHVFGARCGAPMVDAGALPEGGLGFGADVMAIAVEVGPDGPPDEEGLLHLMNWFAETSRTILLVSRQPPARWPVGLPDLSSRLAAVPTVGLRPPDDSLLAAILIKLFHDRQIQIGHDIPAYVLPRLPRSFAAIRDFVARADRFAMAQGRRITIPLVREVLRHLDQESMEDE